MISADAALVRLRDGNRRFVANESTASPLLTPSQRLALTNGQAPFAIVLGCSDSRVPAELVFDQGFGDLFVIRVAGNIVAPSQVGSVEFAAARFGTRLVVVMGHSQCGAVTAAVEEVLGRATNDCRSRLWRQDAAIAASTPWSPMPCAPTCVPPSITCAMDRRCSKG
jgi:carbonic anhydrase